MTRVDQALASALKPGALVGIAIRPDPAHAEQAARCADSVRRNLQLSLVEHVKNQGDEASPPWVSDPIHGPELVLVVDCGSVSRTVLRAIPERIVQEFEAQGVDRIDIRLARELLPEQMSAPSPGVTLWLVARRPETLEVARSTAAHVSELMLDWMYDKIGGHVDLTAVGTWPATRDVASHVLERLPATRKCFLTHVDERTGTLAAAVVTRLFPERAYASLTLCGPKLSVEQIVAVAEWFRDAAQARSSALAYAAIDIGDAVQGGLPLLDGLGMRYAPERTLPDGYWWQLLSAEHIAEIGTDAGVTNSDGRYSLQVGEAGDWEGPQRAALVSAARKRLEQVLEISKEKVREIVDATPVPDFVRPQ